MATYAGDNLPSFTQWADVTGPLILGGPQQRVNDAQATNYNTLGYLLRGQPMAKVVQGGSEIRSRVYLSANRTSRSYKPGATQQYAKPESGKWAKFPYRFFLTHIAWNDETVILNMGALSSDPDARSQQYKDYFWELRQDMWTDNANFWEEIFWAQPKASEMEGNAVTDTGQELASIPVFITENASGTHAFEAGATNDEYNNGGNVAGIDPDTNSGWANTTATYSSFTAGTFGNVISALDDVWLETDFKPAPMHPEMFEAPSGMGSIRPFVAASKTGVKQLMHLFRTAQDRWQDERDPWNRPVYNGAPIVHVAQLDTAALYDDGSNAFATETGAGTTGPRYWGINPKYLHPVYHAERYFESLGVMTDQDTPTEHVMPINTYANLCCSSRKRQWILSPSTNL